MKSLLIVVALVFSSLTLAQDAYHSFEAVECGANESCLIKDGLVTKLIDVVNDASEIEDSKPSNDSFIADYFYQDAKVCFTGDANEICKIMDLMSSANGGDGVIHNISCKTQENKIDLKYALEYYGYGIEDLEFEVKRCDL